MNKSIKKVVSIALSATTVVWLTGASAVLPVAFAQSTASEIASLQALITQLTAQLGALQGSSSVASPVSPVVSVSSGACGFTRNLTVGSTGADVKCLQQYLNGAGFVLASSGAGSPGNETSYFGSITKAAVVKWQDANVAGVLAPVGLAKGTGFWGASSRGHYDSVAGAAPVVPPVTPGTGVTPPVVGTPVPVGGLVVSLGSGSPASANIPKGASSVPFLQLVVSGSGKLDSLTFVRTGLGAVADFRSGGVYLYDGATRLTTGKSVNGTTHGVIFVSLNQTISGSKTYTLVADICTTSGSICSTDATAGNLSAFRLTHVNGEALASVVDGNNMAVSAVTAGRITIAENGSVAAPNLGSQDVKLGEFKLTADSVEDLDVRRIVLTQGGSTNAGNLTNLELRQAGAKLAEVAGYTGRDLFVFELAEPFRLLKGQNRVFEIYGDVSPLAKTSETINLYVDNTADVLATGRTYGWGTAVTNSWASGDQTLTLLGAEMVITWHGPKARNIEANGQDVILFEFSVSAKNNIEIRNLRTNNTVTNITAGTEGFNDFKVIDVETGAAVTTSYTVDEDTDDHVFSDVINVSAGSVRRFAITADIDADNDTNDTITVNLAAFGASDVKNLDNNTFLTVATDIVPSGAISGTLQTVKTTSVEVSAGNVPGVHTTVAGAANEDLLGINLTARNGAVKVTSIKVSASSTNGSRADVQNALRTLGLYIDGNLVSSKKSLVNDGTVISSATFSSLNLAIPEGQTKTVIVRADAIATDAAAKVYFVFADKANITTVDIEGNDITPSTANVNGSATSAGTITTTVGSASIMVTSVASNPEDLNLVANGTRSLGEFKFFAQYADQVVTKLKVGVNTAATAATTTALNEEVALIKLYDSNDNELASGVLESGTHAGAVRFENVKGIFTVNANETKRIKVKALLNALDPAGVGATGTTTAVYVSGGQFESVAGATTNTTLKDGGGATIAATSGSVGSLKRIYRSKPIITVSSPSTSYLTVGDVELLKFTIASDQFGEDLVWGKLTATLGLSNVRLTANSMKVRYAGNDLTTTTKTVSGAVGLSKAQAVIGLATTTKYNDIPGNGGSKTYSLMVNVLAASTTASISTYLSRDETTYADSAAYLTNEAATNSFVWSDLSLPPQDEDWTKADWVNGFNVVKLPSDSIAIIRTQ